MDHKPHRSYSAPISSTTLKREYIKTADRKPEAKGDPAIGEAFGNRIKELESVFDDEFDISECPDDPAEAKVIVTRQVSDSKHAYRASSKGYK
mmetsp:Transcript_9502/g.14303  ORF Transcript_9502/g.14303 Transcript_9502/m.14303 type:complete len:93 (-) Transcript_9502:227-505(-)|eukprot:CAMPEP_0185025534 /NCGR_PEP_ID=MMETSP1103-20130426/8451_1 /TAXON_ID=36769 /ORGANISM="Paraphysomonas bandaiensis, Strain Caron Lab Isolate" /LENGTH=92 /DNA_ID=CAMNT_0027558747 /DNA_START=154 /DNA_END=432 /DNA_ORIENTATION=+